MPDVAAGAPTDDLPPSPGGPPGDPELPSTSGAATVDAARRRRTRAVAVGVGALLAVVALVSYAWPAMARSGGRVDVVLAGDGQVQASQQALERHLRERGLSVTSFVAASSSLCAQRDQLEHAVRQTHPSLVVLSFRRAEPACAGVAAGADPTFALYDQVLHDVGGRRVVLVVQPGVPGAAQSQDQAVQTAYAALLAARRATVADPSTLLGGPAAPASMPCQWWDDCHPDGTVEVRTSPGGALTGAGSQRVARVVVGAIP